MRRTHRWETPAVYNLKYQKPYATWRSCAQKSTKTRYEREMSGKQITSPRVMSAAWTMVINRHVVSDRRGYLKWRESRVPEETGDTAPTTTTLLKAEKGEQDDLINK